MKKRILCALLSLGLCLTPVLAQRAPSGYADVQEGDWFAPYISACTEAGLMQGTGNNAFSPRRALSQAESLALAARLHKLQNGGDGLLPDAPTEWGRLSLTTSDGKTAAGYLNIPDASSQQGEGFFLCYPGKSSPQTAALWVGEDRAAWGKAMNGQKATLTAEGKTYSGMTYLYDYGDGRRYLYFLPGGIAGDPQGEHCDTEAYSALGKVLEHLERYCPAPAEGQWLRNACYYAVQHGLDWLSWDFRPRMSAYSADRPYFAFLLADAAGELEAINEVGVIPDLAPGVYQNLYIGQEELQRVYKLYRAGILGGVDAQGNFDPSKALTRAEAATMISRVLRPELRLTSTPAPTPTPTPNPTPTPPPLPPAQSQTSSVDMATFVNSYLSGKDDAPYFYYGDRAASAGDFLTAALTNADELGDLCAQQGAAFAWSNTLDLGEQGRTSFLAYVYTRSNTAAINSADAADPQAVYAAWQGQTYKAKHILVTEKKGGKDTADMLYEVLKNDPDQFDPLLTIYGEDPGMAANPGGYLFGPGDMVAEFEAGTKALQPGQISQPIQSSYGWHIILRLPLTQADYAGDSGWILFADDFPDGIDVTDAYAAWLANKK